MELIVSEQMEKMFLQQGAGRPKAFFEKMQYGNPAVRA
jgi:hypothetical protein